MLIRLILSLSILFNLTCDAITGTSYTTKQNLIDRQANPRDPRVSVFSDLVVGQRYDSFNIQFLYTIPTDLVTTSTTSTGTVSLDSTTTAMALVATGTNSAGAASVSSIAPLRYLPGHEAYVLYTAAFTAGVASSTQWAGLFDTDNGFALGYNGTQFSILYRRGVTGSVTETITPQTSFSIDLLDGTGPSGVVLDPTKLNIYRITYGWLGTAAIGFEVCRRDGVWIPFHAIQRANAYEVPSIYNPVLPMRVEATNAGNTSSLTIKTASWSAGNVGLGVAYRQNQHSVLSKSFGSSGTMIFAIRNNTTFGGKTNRVTVDLVHSEFAFYLKNSSTLSRFKFIKNGSITGASWTEHNSNSSAVSYTDSGSLSGGTELLVVPFAANGSRSVPLLANQMVMTLQPGDTLAIVAYTDTTTSDADVSLVWRETIA